MKWWEERMLAFDVETTGVDYETARIVTAAVALVGGGEPTVPRTWLVNPLVPIPESATRVHGITTERAQAHGLPAPQAVVEVTELLAEHIRAGVPIVAFNARYDLTILDREARRHRQVPLVDYVPNSPVYVIDPFVIDKRVDRFRRGRRKLVDLCAHYAASLDDAHEAQADAVAAARLAYRMGQRVPALGEMELEELHDAQIEWAAFQAQSLEDYFRSRGRAERVEQRWPLVPFETAGVY